MLCMLEVRVDVPSLRAVAADQDHLCRLGTVELGRDADEPEGDEHRPAESHHDGVRCDPHHDDAEDDHRKDDRRDDKGGSHVCGSS